jgi:CMP-N-acetylneuraminic acid synthetase
MKTIDQRKIVALLPMKANSERVKGKNFRDFCGKPLFKWVLDSLLSVEDINKIVINTDARHILEQNGLIETDRILIRDRRPEICGDDVSMNLILEDDISNISSDLYLMTHTTNPFLSTDTIRKAIQKFNIAQLAGTADSLFTVNKVQTRFYRSDCSPVNHNPDKLIRTQDLEPWYEENSNIYIFTRDSFSQTNARIGKKPIMHETPYFESIDIDTPQDWEFAKAVARYYQEQN